MWRRIWRALPVAAMGLLGCGRIAFEPGATAGCPTTDASMSPPPGPARFVAPTGGSDANPGTETAPWATIAFGLANVASDETLVLLDGVYTELLDVDIDGRAIRAATDGGAIFDGQNAAVPCRISASDVTVEGVRCRNGMPNAVHVLNASRVTLKRITAHDAPSSALYRVQLASDVVLEDVAGWGGYSDGYFVVDSARVTLRRCWARWEASGDMYNTLVFITTNTTDAIVENCVLTTSGVSPIGQIMVGVNVFSPSGVVDRNRLFGNVIYGIPDWSAVVSSETSRIAGTRFVDTVVMESVGGLFQRSDASFGIERLTAVNLAMRGGFALSAHSTEPKDADFEISGYMRDSVIGRGPRGIDIGDSTYVTSFEHTNNTLFGVDEPFVGIAADPSESVIDLEYDVDRYGRGAYLIRNSLDTGAEVLRRYRDGMLTDEPLWPWPMEERILREAGASVTFESGGGLWKTLPDDLACP